MANQISLPRSILQHFVLTAYENYDEKGQKIETLAYFLGNGETKVIDTILYPRQSATSTRVNDEGKILNTKPCCGIVVV